MTDRHSLVTSQTFLAYYDLPLNKTFRTAE